MVVPVFLKDLPAIAGSCERVANNLIKALSVGVDRVYEPIGIVREEKTRVEAQLIRAKGHLAILDLLGADPDSKSQADSGDAVFVVHPQVFAFQKIGPLSDYGVSYEDLFECDGFGLPRSAEAIMLNYAGEKAAANQPVDYAGQKAFINLAGRQLHVLQFTRAGGELRRLLSLTPVQAYTEALRKTLGDGFGLADEHPVDSSRP